MRRTALLGLTAFVEALRRQGVTVWERTVGKNPRRLLPRRFRYPAATRVAVHRSAPYAQVARLALKVSLNLGANLSLSLFGLDHDRRTVQGALAAERRALVKRFGIAPDGFRFPTNGSGTPDSQASPRALVQLLRAMSRTRVARAYALMVNDVGSIADIETDVAGVFQDEAEIAHVIYQASH